MHSSRIAAREIVLLVVALAMVKLLALAIDAEPRFFLGDSGSYLHSAITGWIPPDRSFTYPWLIRASALAAGSLGALVALQTLFGIASALLLFAVLRAGFALDARLAGAAALLFAAEPAQLFYERMMMAESASQLALVIQLALVLRYVRNGAAWWVPLYVLAGVVAVSFRMSLLPVALALGAIAPLVHAAFHAPPWPHGARMRNGLRLGAHLALAVACTALLHGGYKQAYGKLAGTAPAYFADEGKMRLGLVVPLVEPQHIARSGLDPALLDEVGLPLDDPRAREAHLWWDNGLYATLRRHSLTAGLDPDRIAGKVAIRALRDAPLGLPRLGLSTVSDYFEPSVATPRMRNDLGDIPLHEGMLQALREHVGYDGADAHRIDRPISRYMAAGGGWLTFCLFALAPLALATTLLRWRVCPGQRDVTAAFALACLGLVASHVLFSHIVSFRYLHPLPWLVLAQSALLWDGLRRLRRGSAQAAAARPSPASER